MNFEEFIKPPRKRATETLRKYITAYKRKYGYTQQQMADNLGMNITTFLRYMKIAKRKEIILKILNIKEKKDIFE